MPMPAAAAVDTPLETALGEGVLAPVDTPLEMVLEGVLVLVDNAVEEELILVVDTAIGLVVTVAVIRLVVGTVSEVADLIEEDP
jgi:hypothetical protein